MHGAGSEKFFNRDLSWLEFNRRVLFQAVDESVPLLERVRFLAIFSSNLDEFFMKRVGFLKRAKLQGITQVGSDEASPDRVLSLIRDTVLDLTGQQSDCYRNRILPQLRDKRVELLDWSELREDERSQANEYFQSRVFPVLTPLAVDPAHPFPFLSNLSTSLGVKLHQPKSNESLFARIKIPNVLPQWVRLTTPDGGIRLVRLMDLVRNNLNELFPEMVIESVTPFRVTRNADIAQQRDDVDDLMDVVEEELRLRRMAQIVRLEHPKGSNPWILELLRNELELEAADFIETSGELDYRTLNEVASLPLPELKYRPWVPVTPPMLTDDSTDIFRAIRERDLLVHYPYESYAASVERFLKAAVQDKDVLAIKLTLYRTEDNSPLIPLLIDAAENGKQVVCVVELKARFDEARNMYWGEMLENAGVHVVYGVVGLKTHTKLMLVVRKEQEDFRFYCHVATGNFNSQTAKLYTDLGLFTADSKVASEAIQIFNYLTGLSLKKNYKKFLVSPINMREQFLELIGKEIENAKAGKPAHIVGKMDSLEDTAICNALYEASAAGVQVDLIIRGFCCLRPGVPGLSERIRVISIIGRFLEHSRVYYFRSGGKAPQDGKLFFGSADWMYRNLNHRVETMISVEDKAVRKELWEYLQLTLEEKIQAWELQSDGRYVLKREEAAADQQTHGLHDRLMNRARERAPRPPGANLGR